MSRLVFNDLTELMAWVEDPNAPVLGNQYQLIITSHNEAIFTPTKSTRSLKYGYYKGSAEEMFEITEEVRIKRLFISVIRVKSYDWDTTRPVRSKEE